MGGQGHQAHALLLRVPLDRLHDAAVADGVPDPEAPPLQARPELREARVGLLLAEKALQLTTEANRNPGNPSSSNSTSTSRPLSSHQRAGV